MEDNANDLRRLYKAHYASLMRFARRFVPDEDAKDVVHDVFAEVWQKGTLRCDDETAEAYLFRGVRNRCINFLKHKQIEKSAIQDIELENRLLELDYYDSAEKRIIDYERMQDVYRRIDMLPKRCCEIFKLAYFEDKKSSEIAEILNLSKRTVEHQLYLALKTLREFFAK